MDPIRHVEQEETVDLHGRREELRAEVASSFAIDGDAVVLAGVVRVGPRGLHLVGDGGATPAKRRMAELTSRLRDLNDGLGVSIADERLAALASEQGGHAIVAARVDAARQFGEAIDRALEALALFEETPAVEVDFVRLHGVLVELATLAAAPLDAPLTATHVTELTFRL